MRRHLGIFHDVIARRLLLVQLLARKHVLVVGVSFSTLKSLSWGSCAAPQKTTLPSEPQGWPSFVSWFCRTTRRWAFRGFGIADCWGRAIVFLLLWLQNPIDRVMVCMLTSFLFLYISDNGTPRSSKLTYRVLLPLVRHVCNAPPHQALNRCEWSPSHDLLAE